MNALHVRDVERWCRGLVVAEQARAERRSGRGRLVPSGSGCRGRGRGQLLLAGRLGYGVLWLVLCLGGQVRI